MIILLLAFSVLHALFFFQLFLGWKRIASSVVKPNAVSFSVIIPVRNEEEVIEKLLACLEYQEYSKHQYEVIVVDDFSEDATVELVKKAQVNFKMDLSIVCLEDPQKSGKKRALTKGVESAKYDFILTTDADCQMGPLWLSSYAEKASVNKFIAGPVALKGKGIFSNLQQTEFSGLIGFGAVTLTNKNPSMCSGANLGFDKQAFFEVGGYESNLHLPSGDDEFLLFSINEKYPDKVSFLKNKSAVVDTLTHDRLSNFINQRIRWTSKWKHNKNMKLRLTAILFFMDYTIFLAGFITALVGSLSIWYYLPILIFRWIVNCVYIVPIQKFLGHKNGALSLLIIQIIYPFHVLFMGVNSIFGRYTWKGRTY